MAGGQRFQARVIAWWAAHILLETHAGARFSLPSTAIAERIYPENGRHTDDLLVDLTGSCHLYGQCKTALSLGKGTAGEWAKVLIQLARQKASDDEGDAATSGAKLPTRRYVVFYGRDNRSLLRLAAILDRYRGLPDGAGRSEAAVNDAELAIVANLERLLDGLAAAHSGDPVSTVLGAGREALLRRVCISQLRLGDGEADALGVQQGLQHDLVANPADAPRAMDLLRSLAGDLMADRQSCDRTGLRDRLAGAGIALKGAASFSADFQRMAELTTDELMAHESQGRRVLCLGGQRIQLERTEIVARLAGPSWSSFLVVGGAGVGKTGALMDAAVRLRDRGARIWYWAADSLPGSSPAVMQRDLGLGHGWAALFGEANAAGGIVLIIDGLDGLRDAGQQQAYRSLIGIALRCGARVIASIRSFDVQFASELQRLFKASVESSAAASTGDAPLGPGVNAVAIGDLDDTALGQVCSALAPIQAALDVAPSLRSVVRNLFSLSLLCHLLDGGEDAVSLGGIATQAQLFDAYWQRRIGDQSDRNALQETLAAVVTQMVEEHRLQVLPRLAHRETIDRLLSMDVLRRPGSLPGRAVDPDRVEFAHHLLFDYAAERLFVRPRRARLGPELTADNPWPLMLRPSLVLFFRYLWAGARLDFWDTLMAIEGANATGLHRFSAYAVIAEEARARVDFEPLFVGARGSEAALWNRVLRGVVVAAPFTVLPRLFAAGSGVWWLQLAYDLVVTDDLGLGYLGRRLLFAAADHVATLTHDARRLFNEAAIALARLQLSKEPPTLAIHPAIAWVCRTIASNKSRASGFLRELMHPDEIARTGYVILGAVDKHIDVLAACDPALAREVYDAAFAHTEESNADTPIGGAILPMRSNRRQDYEIALYGLGKEYPKLFDTSPTEGTRAAIAVMGRIATRRGAVEVNKLPLDQVTIDGQVRRLRDDRSHGWHAAGMREEGALQILDAWEAAAVDLGREGISGSAAAERAQHRFEGAWQVLANENEYAGLWRRLLTAAARVPEFYAQRLWRLLLEPAILAGTSTIEAAAGAIAAFSTVLDAKSITEIESAILNLTEARGDGERGRADIKRAKPYLLERIPKDRRSMRAIDVLEAQGSRKIGAPTDDPLIYSGSRSVSTASLLEDAGVDVSAPAHASLLDDIAILEAVDSDGPTAADPDAVMSAIHRVEGRLAGPDKGIDPHLASTALSHIVRAASQLACSPTVLNETVVSELAERFERGLAEKAEQQNEEYSKRFDEMAVLSPDAVRTNAASGLVGLAIRPGALAKGEAKLREIAADPEPQVRFQLASRLWKMAEFSPGLVWEVLESWAAALPERGQAGVVKFALAPGWFWWLRARDEARADRLLLSLLDGAHANGNHELREIVGRYFGVLCFDADPPWSRDTRARMLVDSSAWADELRGMLHETVTKCWPRRGPTDDNKRGSLLRAREMAVDVLHAIGRRLREYENELRGTAPDHRPIEPPSWVTTHVGAFHLASGEFRIASIAWARAVATVENSAAISDLETGGVAAANEFGVQRPGDVACRPSAVEFANWIDLSAPMLDAVLSFPQASAAYDLIQALEAVAPVDPSRALAWLRRVTEATVETGITTESLAADRTIDVLARIFSSDAALLASNGTIRADFLRVLELYLDVGWPKAVELALRIETIFRAA